MKYLFFLLFPLISCNLNSSQNGTIRYDPSQQVFYNGEKEILFDEVIGQSVNSFFEKNNLEYHDYYFRTTRIIQLTSAAFFFSEEYEIEIYIYIDTDNHLKRIDGDRSWKIEEFMKERISRIEVLYKNSLISTFPSLR